MNVVLSVIALCGLIVIGGCTGEEITPATSAAPVAAGQRPAGSAVRTRPQAPPLSHVSDVEVDLVGPGDLPRDAYAFLGYGFAAARRRGGAGRSTTPTPPPWQPFGYLVDLSLAEADAVPPPVDLDAFFTAATAASADGEWERGPEMQQPPLVGWEAPPLDAK